MSERYGSPGEAYEALQDLGTHLEELIAGVEQMMRTGTGTPDHAPPTTYDPRYDAGRMAAYREILDVITVNPGG